MLSSALYEVLERARTRFGLEVEILDGELRALYPEAGSEFSKSVHANTELRQTLREVLVVGHPREVEDSGERYRIYPLRKNDQISPTGALLAIKGTNGAAADAMPWSEFARAAIEADLSSGDKLREQRQQSRRLLAVLRFLRYLIETTDEGALLPALVQAAAVWFDVDARIYRRSLSGDFVLQCWLPGVEPDEASRHLDVQVIGVNREVKRLVPSHELGGLGSLGGETVVVPLAGLARNDVILTLSGAVPTEADAVFQVVGSVVGMHLENLRSAQLTAARRRYEAIVCQSGLAAERIALQAVADLMQTVGASAASLTLLSKGDSRRLAAFGPPADDVPAVNGDTCVLSDHRFACGLTLAGNHTAMLELRPSADAPFTPDGGDVTRICAEVLQLWLTGTVSSFSDPTELLETAPPTHAFERRIEEELERAKRFDLDLALVLVDVAAPSRAVDEILETLRRELRGSDLLGTTSGRHVAALLTHTDDRGLDNVVIRLRRRLADTADRLKISDVRLGQAALSAECRTADALLSRAVREAEAIVVH
jgi:hypothetical protein